MTGVRDLFAGESSLVPGTLRGYRTWLGITPHTGRLQSTGLSWHAWGPAPYAGASHTAECYAGWGWGGNEPCTDHEAPAAECTCGLYAWYDPADRRIPLTGCSGPVFGVVQATGRVILGTHGFRAQRMEVLAVTSEDEATRTQLRRYGYPVHDSAEAMFAAYPPENVSGLVDHACEGECLERASYVTGSLRIGNTLVPLPAMPAGAWVEVQIVNGAVRIRSLVAGLHTAWIEVSRKPASQTAPKQPSCPTQGPMHGPLTVAQQALEDRRRRNTGPTGQSLFRSALKRGRS